MLLILAAYKKLIIVVLLILIVLSAVHWVLRRERDKGYKEAVAEYTTKALIAEVDARRKESQLIKQLKEAQDASVLRNQEIKKLSDALAVSTGKLRDTTNSIRQSLPTNSAETNRITADAALAVFDECAGEYTKVAENADGHASDVKTLEDAP